MPGTLKHLEMVNRTSIKVKDFTQTPMDYISVDLEYKILKRVKSFEVPEMLKSSRKRNEPKTRYCGHLSSRLSRVWTQPYVRVGLFYYMGGGVKGLKKGNRLGIGGTLLWLMLGV